jgi:diamine N-acetyltransferase
VDPALPHGIAPESNVRCGWTRAAEDEHQGAWLKGGTDTTSSTADSRVALCEVTAENLRAVLALDVAESQRSFVASNARSIAETHFHPEAWFRAIYAGSQPVGFLMLHDESLRPQSCEQVYYFLWRLMIDGSYQGRGFGRRAIELLLDHVRTRPDARELLTSCRRGAGSPEGFYLRLGFRPTGQIEDGEFVLRLPL